MVIVAFGTRRERYDSAYEVQCYSGIAPVKEASGTTSWVHFRRACPMFLRQAFHEFALHSIGQSEWAKAYSDHLRKDEKKTHHAAATNSDSSPRNRCSADCRTVPATSGTLGCF